MITLAPDRLRRSRDADSKWNLNLRVIAFHVSARRACAPQPNERVELFINVRYINNFYKL